MIPRKPAPDLIRGGSRFSDKIMLHYGFGRIFYGEPGPLRRKMLQEHRLPRDPNPAILDTRLPQGRP